MDPYLVGVTAATATAVVVVGMLADTMMSQTGGEDGGTTAATTGGGTAATAPELQPLQPKSSSGAGKSSKSARSKQSRSLMASLTTKKPTAAKKEPPGVDEAEQQAIEDEQRAKLPPKLQLQAGFASDNHGGKGTWTILERPPRCKESKASAALKAKLLGHIANCFAPETVLGRRIAFEPADVAEVLGAVTPYLESEPMMIEDLPFGITVVGDLHGQLHDLHRILAHDEKDGKPGWECMKYLFLGDYVDRGRQSLEILMALFSIKILYPDRVFLLRGNHEFIRLNMGYGFHKELLDRYDKKTANQLMLYFNGVFDLLSICAIVQDKYFCAHGGVSAHGFTRSNLRAIEKPYHWTNDDHLGNDICWADPAEGLRGTVYNGDRQCSIYFGLDTLVHALYTIGAEILVRGHSNLSTGYSITGNGMCVSLFSATASGGANDGSVMFIDDEGYYKVSLLKMSADRVFWERKLRELDDGFEEEEHDEKTVDPDKPTDPKKFRPQA